MKEIKAAVIMTGLMLVLLCGAYPAVIWALGQVLFPEQANGSLVYNAKGQLIGSKLIGQKFSQDQFFHPRPSAAGSGYEANNSAGTNLGPISRKLVEGVVDDPRTPADESFIGLNQLAAAYRKENGLPSDAELPADAITRSGSGLDPDISPQNAYLQAARVASARRLSQDVIEQLIDDHTRERFLQLFGEHRVNVFEINLALEELNKRKAS